MVQTGTENDHRLAIRLLGIGGKGASRGDDLLAIHTCNRFCPGRCVRRHVVVIACHVIAAETTVKAVIGAHQVKHGDDQCLTVLQGHPACRQLAGQDIRVIGSGEMIVMLVAEIGKADIDRLVMAVIEDEGQLQLDLIALAGALFEIPLALLAPSKTDRSKRRHIACRLAIIGDRLPVRIVVLTEIVGEVRGPEQPSRNIAAILLSNRTRLGMSVFSRA